MIKIDCRKCLNLLGQNLTGPGDCSTRCKIYGPDPAKAARACARDKFRCYYPIEPVEFEPGMTVWCVQRDAYGVPVAMDAYMYLATVQTAVIVSPDENGEDTLDGVLTYHAEETQAENETMLCVFDACDCYPTESLAREAMDRED